MKKRVISACLAGGLAATGLVVTAATAQASAPVRCGVSKHSGQACVLVNDNTGGEVHSIRVQGQCLLFSNSSTRHYYGNVYVPLSLWPDTLTYSGYNCEGNTQNTMNVNWHQGSGEDTNFRTVDISIGNSGPAVGGGCGVAVQPGEVIHC